MKKKDDRLRDIESRLDKMEIATTKISMDHHELKRSVAEHDEWMRKFETKLESAKVGLDSVRKEMRASSFERLAWLGTALTTIFIFFVLTQHH